PEAAPGRGRGRADGHDPEITHRISGMRGGALRRVVGADTWCTPSSRDAPARRTRMAPGRVSLRGEAVRSASVRGSKGSTMRPPNPALQPAGTCACTGLRPAPAQVARG